MSRYVQESQWHASQKLTKQRDGSLLAEFHLDDTVEIKSWIMSFGRNAVVLEPEQLRKGNHGRTAIAAGILRPQPTLLALWERLGVKV